MGRILIVSHGKNPIQEIMDPAMTCEYLSDEIEELIINLKRLLITVLSSHRGQKT